MAVAKENLRFMLKKQGYSLINFSVLFDMSHNIFSYLVSRKIKVYNAVWLLKKKHGFFGTWTLNLNKISDRKRHIQNSSSKF